MALRFLTGRADIEKSDFCINEIRDELLKRTQGPPIFYIVPDQMTFQKEYALFNDESIRGSIRAQVVSFSRLAWRVLQETGGSTRPFISSVGVQMTLRRIMEERQAEWHVFQRATDKQGFLSDLERMITEFKRHQVTPTLLKEQINHIESFVHKEPGERALANKLSDLSYIYENLVEALRDNYIDTEDQLQLLADKINETSFLNEATIYLDGFHRFTPQELLVVEALLKKCKDVTVVLTKEEQENHVLSELDLFYQTTETYNTLKEIARQNNIPLKEEMPKDKAFFKFNEQPAFAHLEKYFDTLPSPRYKQSKDVPIQLAEAVHPRAEVEGVAQEIIRLLREENYRFRDMAIFVREADTYKDLIATIFEDYHIPVFVDEKRTMLNHPFIEFLRSLFDVIEGDWRYDAVFRLLKTGFIPIVDKTYPLTESAIDELENYVLEYGIRSRRRWFEDDEWKFQRFRGFDQAAQTDKELNMQAKINKYREQIVAALKPFDEQIREASTVRELCEITYLLLEEIQAPRHLEKMRQEHDEAGNIQEGREQEQVWLAIVQLFDELVEIAGNEAMTLSTFRKVLESGFETLEFAHVPPSIDHVIVGTIDHSRISGIKCAFLLGVNEGSWPMKPPVDGMINEQERELLENHGLKLAESSRRRLLDDWFYMYLAFTAPTNYLWVSYVLSDEEGSSRLASSLIRRLTDLFPSCQQPILLQDLDDMVDADRFITVPEKTRSALTAQLARKKRGYPIQPSWLHVLNWYINNHSKESMTYDMLQSLYYENKPRDLKEDTVAQMYPKKVKTSVSRLEMHYRCSFQHFAQYSLGLQERKIYKLDAPDIGQLFHEALKTITEWVQKEEQDFAALTKQKSDQYAQRAIQSLGPILQHRILTSSNRYKYITYKLQEVIAKATFILSEQARQSGFSPIGIELGFGEKEQLQPLQVTLPNDYELILRGRIDRVDQARKEDGLYLRIIDYKSSNRGLSLVEIYYGLALQMLAYLDIVLTQSERWLGERAHPAGVLYFHVHDAMHSDDMRLDESAIEHELFKKYKMQGLLLANEDIVKMMDMSLDAGVSQIVPAGLKKNGGFYSHSKVATEDTFSQLKNHIHQLIIEAGIDMTTGKIELNPYEYGAQHACTYCAFKSICQFDPMLEENKFRKLKQMKDTDILDMLRQGGEDE